MKKGWYWPWFIAALLVATVAGQGVMLWAATHDATMSIEPDYYQKGVQFDSVIAQRATNARLGWQVALAVGPLAASGDDVSARLTDPAGATITGARVRVTAIHNLDGDHHVQQTLREGTSGNYAARLPLDRAGLWEIRLDVTRGADHFTADARVDVAGAASPAPPAR